ncbi:MAG: SDR family oxidoreductase [Pseudomonadota bacterium]
MAHSIFSISSRPALVTGAGTGIGEAIATRLSQAGAPVALCDIDLDAATVAAAKLDNAVAVEMDVTSASSIEAGFAAAEAAFGPIRIVVANAGVSSMTRALDITEEDWAFNFNVNAKGVFLTNQAACRRFIQHETPGAIVNTASLAAKVGAPLLAHYSASKFAVLGWTQALAKEMAVHGIRVNAVCPGFVRTSMQDREIIWEAELRDMTPDAVFNEYVSMTPLGRIEEPMDVADVVLFLASDAARFMTGQGINVTGGVRMD